MIYKRLKWVRVGIALIFIFLTTLVFLDFRELFNENAVSGIIWPQFVPSLVKFLTIFSISAAGFLIILLLTVFFGRVYCSAVCPLGIFQDFLSRTGKYFKKKKKYKYAKPKTILRNAILAITVLTGIFFSIFLVNLLDPYSMYGKMATGLFRPVGIWVNNGIADILESMNVYYLYHLDINPGRILTFLLPLIILGTLIYMAGKYGRLYCNTVCPVGTLLGWISRISVFRIVMDNTKCTQCGKCSFECKSQCISVKDIHVDNSRCVSCFNCLTVCPDDAIHFSYKRDRKLKTVEVSSVSEGRKNFLTASFGAILAFAGIKKVYASGGTPSDEEPININPTTIPVEKESVVSPPGSLSVDHFSSLCTACQLCVSQCPTKVLQPSISEYGITGFMQPFMDFSTNYCNFECTRCTDVCPTGAILKVGKEEKRTLQIGKVHFIKENCVVYTENTACGSCSEHCPTQAVRMIPYEGSLTIPETDNSICVGCGACEYACPVVPHKAIYVDGNPIHETAKEPEQEKLEGPDMEEDFPF